MLKRNPKLSPNRSVITLGLGICLLMGVACGSSASGQKSPAASVAPLAAAAKAAFNARSWVGYYDLYAAPEPWCTRTKFANDMFLAIASSSNTTRAASMLAWTVGAQVNAPTSKQVTQSTADRIVWQVDTKAGANLGIGTSVAFAVNVGGGVWRFEGNPCRELLSETDAGTPPMRFDQ